MSRSFHYRSLSKPVPRDVTKLQQLVECLNLA
jgi:hypothetical protein